MRRRALSVLVAVEAGKGFADQHLRGEDAPFVRELVMGVLRRRLTLDTILGAYLRRPLDGLEPQVRAALRIGLQQILFLDGVPPHAAVSETVSAVGKASAKAFINGVLRAILRECNTVPPDRDRGGASPTKRLERPGRNVTFFSRAVFPDPERDRVAWLAAVHSHPPFLVRRWVDAVGEEQVVARMEQGNDTPPFVLRPRAGRVDAEGVVAALMKEGVPAGVLARDSGPDAVLVARGAKGVLSGKAFRGGLFSVQDAEQMDAAEILAPKPGEVVWDACAAPGGKAAQLAELLAGEGRVVATDVNADRLTGLSDTVARLGLEGVEVAAYDLLSDDPPPGCPEGGFDAILLDAPCSNSAVLARRPEARWRLTEQTLAELVALQERLLAAARRHLASDGRLVWSVCSHEPEEGAGHGLHPTRSPFVSSSQLGT
jgi:16S rRNA (cytosine967-C5)-methyltransferase